MPDNDPEFDEFIREMEAVANSGKVQVVEVAENASMVEITVPMEHYPHPEVTLMETCAEYLGKTERRAVIAMNVTYELRNGNHPFLIATIMLTQPV